MQTDFETYSEVDISTCGSYRYIDDDSFEPLLLAVAFDDEEAFMVDLACGEDVPECVWAAIFDPEIIKTAWNAQFERTIFGKMAGETLSPDSWKCTMVWSASLSLPLALKTAAQVLKTGEQKDSAGEALIRYFSIPCKPTKANGGRTRNLPEHNPESWQKFKEYCLQDVSPMQRIPKITFPRCDAVNRNLPKDGDKLSTPLLYERLEALKKSISPIWKECSALSSQSPPRRPNPSSAPDAVALPSSRHKCAPRYTSCTEALQIWPKSCPSVHLLDRRTLPVSVFFRK